MATATATARASAVAQADPPPPLPKGSKPQRIKVRIQRKPDGRYEAKSTHDLPSSAVVFSFFNKTHQGALAGYYYHGVGITEMINWQLNRGPKAKDFANAIAAATAKMMEAPESVESEILAVNGGGFLAMGNAIFKLEAVDYVATKPRALAALRSKVEADAKQEGERIIKVATDEAIKLREKGQMALRTAETKANELRYRIEAQKRENARVIPPWMTNADGGASPIPCYVENGMMFAGIYANLTFKSISFTRNRQVHLVPCLLATPLNTLLWVPLDGEGRDYIRRTRVSSVHPPLPHISYTACMDIGDAPPSVNNRLTLTQLKASIERALSVINLDSLATRYIDWRGRLDEFIPTGILAQWKLAGYSGGDMIRGIEIYEQASGIISQPRAEVAAVFTASMDATVNVSRGEDDEPPEETEP